MGFGPFALGSSPLSFQLHCSLTVADILSTSKRSFMLNYGCIKQRQAFNWVAIQKAGASSWGLSYQIHQGISTSCILNSLILKTKSFSQLWRLTSAYGD